jgi:hypothetical protein
VNKLIEEYERLKVQNAQLLSSMETGRGTRRESGEEGGVLEQDKDRLIDHLGIRRSQLQLRFAQRNNISGSSALARDDFKEMDELAELRESEG